jgi:regulator of replication initiation timing
MSLALEELKEFKEINSKEYFFQREKIIREIIDDLKEIVNEKNKIIKELKESSVSMGPIISANQQIASENIKLKERIKELEEEDPDECEDCEVIRQHLGEQVKRQELRYQKLQLRNKRFNDALTVFNNTINNIKEYDEC